MKIEINEQVKNAVNEMLEDCRRPLAENQSPEGRRIERFMKGLMRKHAKAILKAEQQRARREWSLAKATLKMERQRDRHVQSLVRAVNQGLHRALDAAACL